MAGSRQFTSDNSESLARADSATLSVSDQDFSWAAWVYRDTWGFKVVLAKRTDATHREYALYLDSNNKPAFEIYNAAGTASGTATAANAMSPGWNLLVGYHDSVNNLVGISVNGGAFVTGATSDVPSDTTGAFTIGAQSSPAANFWDGRIARVGFWKGRVLTEANALALYNNGRGYLYASLPSALTTNLTCYWNLNETSGDATDSVGSQTLTDTNTVTAARGPDDSTVYVTCGYELGNVTAEVEAITGTGSIQGTTTRTGSYAFRFNPTTTAVGWHRLAGWTTAGLKSATSSNVNLNSGFFRGYFRYATKPSADNEPILRMMTNAGTAKLGLRLDSDGKIQVWDETSPAALATSTTVLSANTWYRIEVGTAYATAPWAVKIFANDVNANQINTAPLETLTGSLDQLSAPFGQVDLGKRTNANGRTVDCFWDDCAIADSWTGPGRVGVLKVSGAGTTNTFNAGTWEDVDDNPHDSATTVLSTTSSVAGQVFTGNMENLGTAGINHNRIHLIQPIAIAKADSGTLTFQNRFISGVSTTTTAAGSLSTSEYVGFYNSFYRDPDTLVEWTANLVNAIECGCVLATSDSVCRVTSVVAVVDFGWAIQAEDNPGQIAKNRPPRAIGPPGRIPKTSFLLIPPGRMGRDGIPYVADSVDLLTGTVSHWKFEEASGTRDDAIGSNDLAETGTVGSTTGKIGTCAVLEAGEILSKSQPTFIGNTGAFTIPLWVYLEGAASTLNVQIGSNLGDQCYINIDVNRVRLGIAGSDESYPELDVAPTLAAGAWHLVIAKFVPASLQLQVKVNNGSAYTLSAPAANFDVTDASSFCQINAAGGTSRVDGALYSTTAWSDAQDAAYWNSGSGTETLS